MTGPAGPRPAISIVLRSKDDAPVIGVTLERVFGQSRRDFEVLSVDSGSTDGTPAILDRYPCRRFALRAGEYVPGRVLNWMAREALADVLVFLNSDATPLDAAWLERLVGRLEARPALAGVYGRQLPRPGAAPWVRRDYGVVFPARATGAVPFIFSLANSAIRRRAWEEVPFDERLDYSEDEDWARRVRARGWETAYAPDACVEHSHDYPLRQLARRFYGEGRADAAIYAGAVPPRLSFARLVVRKTLVDSARDARACAATGAWRRIPEAVARRSLQNAARWLGVRRGAELRA